MSQTKLRSAKFSIHELVKKDRLHAYASKDDMRHMLLRCIKDLHELGYKLGHIKGLKPKHIHALVEHWISQEKNPGTIKNYMSKLRITSRLLNQQNLVQPSNAVYGIVERSYRPMHNKAIQEIDFSTCTDHHIKLSLEGQALFGFRREESMKFTLSESWHGNTLKIMPSWTKGGVGRTLTVTNNAQRQWLHKVSALVQPGESLIPRDRSYKKHLDQYQTQIKAMGVCKLHGLRHAYAQRRYKELTALFDNHKVGLISPIAGGKPFKGLTSIEKYIDRKARWIISRELGHSRINITKIYLG